MAFSAAVKKFLASIDSMSGGSISLSNEHAHIHSGEAFQIDYEFIGVLTTAVSYVVITVPSTKVVHLRKYLVNSDLSPHKIELFEAPTLSGEGTTVTVFDRNRVTDNTAGATVRRAPTVTGDGTLIDLNYLRATTDKFAGGGDAAADPEWDLAPSTQYMLKITNNNAGTADIHVKMFWYEHDA